MAEQIKYLLNPLRRGTAAHIWTGEDTACHMWSTNGMNKKKTGLTVSDNSGEHRICLMCTNNREKEKRF